MATLGLVTTIGIPLASDNKYTRGVVGFFTGSETYPGAALLSVGGALAVGIGMVRYLGPRSVGEQVLQSYPEVVLAAGSLDCLCIGSGQDRSVSDAEVQTLQAAPIAVIDAFALQTVDFSKTAKASVLTPHLGEFRRLQLRFGLPVSNSEEPDELVPEVIKLATLLGRFVLLKGSTSILGSATGEIRRVGPNSSWLATAGTGDVLTGVLGALLAANLHSANPQNIMNVVELGVKVHSRAAELAATKGPVSAHTLLTQLGTAALEFLE